MTPALQKVCTINKQIPHNDMISILVYHEIYNLSTDHNLTFVTPRDRISIEMEVKTVKKLLCITLALMLILSACAAPNAPTVPATDPTVTDPTVTEPPVTEPPVTEPPATEPQPTDPPADPPEPFVAHENFDAAACANLIGTWSVTVTLDKDLQNLSLFTGKTSFTLHYTFYEDGHFETWADEAEFTKAIDDYEAMVIDHMVDLRYITFMGPLEYQGIPEEEIKTRWQNGPEMEARSECADSVAALNLFHRFKRLLREGQYYVNEGKVYTQLSGDKFEANSYTVSGSVLTLRTTTNMSVYRDICVNFPMKLEKSE